MKERTKHQRVVAKKNEEIKSLLEEVSGGHPFPLANCWYWWLVLSSRS